MAIQVILQYWYIVPETIGLASSVISIYSCHILKVNGPQGLLVPWGCKVLELIPVQHKPSLLPVLWQKWGTASLTELYIMRSYLAMEAQFSQIAFLGIYLHEIELTK